MSSTNGTCLRLSIFGESHGPAIGCVIDGLPAGEAFDLEEIRVQMARRAPGRDATATRRVESDSPRLLSGFLEKDGTAPHPPGPLWPSSSKMKTSARGITGSCRSCLVRDTPIIPAMSDIMGSAMCVEAAISAGV